MDIVASITNNFIHPPVLFFILGLVAVLLRSDLEIPNQIGIRGGEELFHSGWDSQGNRKVG